MPFVTQGWLVTGREPTNCMKSSKPGTFGSTRLLVTMPAEFAAAPNNG